MITFLKKYSTLIFMSLLVILLALAWIFPSSGLKLGIAFLLLTFFMASVLMLDKHAKAYRNGDITRGVFIRNAVIEIVGTALIMALAGLAGRTTAELATQPISHHLLRVAAGIGVGMLVGMGVGALAKKMLQRLVVISPKAQG